ncbi:MAG: hypothetical protein U5K69_06675 [Balneolaceae bacterium]|nr:hypothetical protein [Balneolaceae bacterium]
MAPSRLAETYKRFARLLADRTFGPVSTKSRGPPRTDSPDGTGEELDLA